MSLKVSRILPFSCVDGPGNRLVIFLQGCNYRCVTCHNPHTMTHCDHCGECLPECASGALRFENGKVVWDEAACDGCDRCIEVCPSNSNPKVTEYSIEQLLELIKLNALFIEGITVSGGEATLQLAGVSELFKAVKSSPSLAHLSCFIDSNGSLSETGWQRVAPYLDGVMLDVKAWQPALHNSLVGKDNQRVFASADLLVQLGKLYEVRLLYVPEHSDHLWQVDALAQWVEALPDDVALRVNGFSIHGVRGEAKQWQACSDEQRSEFITELTTRLVKHPQRIVY